MLLFLVSQLVAELLQYLLKRSFSFIISESYFSFTFNTVSSYFFICSSKDIIFLGLAIYYFPSSAYFSSSLLNLTALSCIWSASISNAFKIIFWVAVTA